jgi:hypothetical protein
MVFRRHRRKRLTSNTQPPANYGLAFGHTGTGAEYKNEVYDPRAFIPPNAVFELPVERMRIPELPAGER